MDKGNRIEYSKTHSRLFPDLLIGAISSIGINESSICIYKGQQE